MICGAKRYIIEFEKDGELQRRSIVAKSPASARRFIRGEYGRKITISSVRREEQVKKI